MRDVRAEAKVKWFDVCCGAKFCLWTNFKAVSGVNAGGLGGEHYPT